MDLFALRAKETGQIGNLLTGQRKSRVATGEAVVVVAVVAAAG